MGLTVATALTLSGCGTGAQPRPGPGGMMGAPGLGHAMRFSTLRCAARPALPGTQVRVLLTDMGRSTMMGGGASGAPMMLHAVPATVPAGRVSFVAANRGWRIHELVVLPLPRGHQAGQRVPDANGSVDESSSLGEASRSCGPGDGDGIRPGTVGWVTLRLTPGRYELICNRPHHYADGMYQELVVS